MRDKILEIKLLGPPEVYCGAEMAKFATRKALAMFAYLVVEGGTHPRDKLQAIFWPESETRLAQSSLRKTLSRIRQALAGVEESLWTEADRVGFNFSSAYTLDLDLISEAVTDPRPGQDAVPSDPLLLQQAADAARGPFLEGFFLPDAPAFDRWSLLERQIWKARLNQVHDRLSNSQIDSHCLESAIETLHRWLRLDQLNEIAYQRLIRLHLLNGNRSAALQIYETCRKLLVRELGVEPSADTEKVLAHIDTSLVTLKRRV